MFKNNKADKRMGYRMIPDEIKPLLIDFISNAPKIPKLEQIILFGSAAKNEMHKKSDIDLLMIMDTEHPETSKEAKIAHKIASDVSKKHRARHSFSMVFANKSLSDVEPDFLWNVAKEGIVIWGKPDFKPIKTLKPWVIISYSLKNISPKNKMAVHRTLYGYRVEKKVGDKIYINESEGIVNKIGKKLGEAVVMLPAKEAESVINALEEHGAHYSLKKIWM